MTPVTALVADVDRCKVLVSPLPDPPEEQLTVSYGSHPPIRRPSADAEAESAANGESMRYTVALDAAPYTCKR